jgi:hypothetical protein
MVRNAPETCCRMPRGCHFVVTSGKSGCPGVGSQRPIPHECQLASQPRYQTTQRRSARFAGMCVGCRPLGAEKASSWASCSACGRAVLTVGFGTAAAANPFCKNPQLLSRCAGKAYLSNQNVSKRTTSYMPK